MLLSELAKDLPEYQERAYHDTEIISLAHDSRKVIPGALFFCVSGTKVDGHSFAPTAVEKGAVALVTEKELELEVPQLIVPDARAAMARMAAAFYGHPVNKLILIGVTGTNGKTSTTYMIRSIASSCGLQCGIIGTIGVVIGDKTEPAEMTTPDPIELQAILARMVDAKMNWVAMEVSAHALDLRKLDGIRFGVSVFTNLTQDHLDYFGDMDTYFAAKARLFTPEHSARAVINIDDPHGAQLAKQTRIPCLAYSVKQKADIYAENLSLSANSVFDLIVPRGGAEVKLPVGGLFNIYNALGAAGAALFAGASVRAVQIGLDSFTQVPGRFNVLDSGRNFLLVIDYAHTPDGLENILKAARELTKGRVVSVFGCGGNRDALKRPIMGGISGRLADYSIITSDNPRFEQPEEIMKQIELGIIETGAPYTMIENRKDAISAAISGAKKGDVIVIAGKGAEDYQEIAGIKHPFSDAEVISELLMG